MGITPDSKAPSSPQGSVGTNKKGRQGKRPGLIVDSRGVVAQEAKQETNGSTDGLLQMHP